MLPSRWTRTALVAVVALVASMFAFQAPADAASTGRVRGGIYGTHGTTPKVTMQWFTKDWTFLGKRKQTRGSYSLSLAPGTYWIQFVDQRPAYDVTKAAPANIKVTVRAGRTTTKSVTMRRGAAITGTVKAGGKPAKGARIVAANPAEQSFVVKANSKGQFALGGLPPGNYSVFTYDRARKYVAKSLWVPKLKSGKSTNVVIRLNKRAGRLLVDLYAGSEPMKKKVSVTVISKANGQFWSTTARHGSASFQGLYPGRYKIVVPGVGNYFGSTGSIKSGKVRAGKVAFGSYRLTKRGAWVTGTVVDQGDGATPLKGARVFLVNASGDTIGSATTSTSGTFQVTGQIASQRGLTIRAAAGQYTQYLEGAHRCKFGATTSAAFTVTSGRQTQVSPALQLPRLPVAQQDDKTHCTAVDPGPS